MAKTRPSTGPPARGQTFALTQPVLRDSKQSQVNRAVVGIERRTGERLTPSALNARPIDLPASTRPILFVVVDTEETFDWDAPFSRANTDVRAMSKVGDLQAVFTPFRIRPLYVIDYPVAAQRDSVKALKAVHDRGECEIGAHLHPWVTPPFIEAVNGPNSFGCNLAPHVQAQKIATLTRQIERSFGFSPRAYKAGRYGFGAATMDVLENLGYDVDVSVNPRMDFTDQRGPSFLAFDARPFAFGRRRTLLELPCTTGYTGLARRAGPTLHPMLDRPALRRTRAVGAMARLSLLNKVMLSPEGSRLDEMCALVKASYASGLRTFALTLHSPSIDPGCTPYVRSSEELRSFIECITKFCEFFLDEMGGVSMSVHELDAWLRAAAVRPDEREHFV